MGCGGKFVSKMLAKFWQKSWVDLGGWREMMASASARG
jgi:hypothetical protein